MHFSSRFADTLTRAGFLVEGQPVEGMVVPPSADELADRFGALFDEKRTGLPVAAIYRGRSSPMVGFVDSGETVPSEEQLRAWQAVFWNMGAAPILWVVAPDRSILLNGLNRPNEQSSFDCVMEITESLGLDVDPYDRCGRLAFESGSFWNTSEARSLKRSTRVDAILVRNLKALEDALVEENANVRLSQKLIGRLIFTRYLVDRGILTSETLVRRFGKAELHEVLSDKDRALRLFDWLHTAFKGDLFPPELPNEKELISESSLELLSQFSTGFEPATGQRSFFPFRFDVIPVELISAIYEQFAHSSAGEEARSQGLHYTPVNLVNLLLDELPVSISPKDKVLDPTCGSGVLLVEAFRRLVAVNRKHRREGETERGMIRRILYEQIHGVDINEGALQVSAFSLYLAALEFDPAIHEDGDFLSFEALIGRNLVCGDFLDPNTLASRTYDLILGNPPWTFDSVERSTVVRSPDPTPRRSPDWAFLWQATRLLRPTGRLGMIMKATPFFRRDPQAVKARRALFSKLHELSLMDLSALRTEGLFQAVAVEGGGASLKRTSGPAMLLTGKAGSPPMVSGRVRVTKVPWDGEFSKHGLLDVADEWACRVPTRRLLDRADLLKAATSANVREFMTFARITADTSLLELGRWAEANGYRILQGVQVGGGDHNDSSALLGLPFLTSPNYRPGRLGRLPTFDRTRVHRPRRRDAFFGPLVLFPEAAFGKALSPGRYSAGYHREDVVFSESFVGMAFDADSDVMARAVCCLMQSKMVAFQLLLGSSNLGVKQPKVEKVDIERLLIPDLYKIPEAAVGELSSLLDGLTKGNRKALVRLDQICAELWGLGSGDGSVIDDALVRTGPVFLDSRAARAASVASVSSEDMEKYLKEAVHWLDRGLAEIGPFHSVPMGTMRLGNGYRLLRIELDPGPIRPYPELKTTQTFELFDDDLVRRLGGRALVHLASARYQRVVSDRTVYVLKPDQRRCWTVSDAQTDVAYLLNHHSEAFRQKDLQLTDPSFVPPAPLPIALH